MNTSELILKLQEIQALVEQENLEGEIELFEDFKMEKVAYGQWQLRPAFRRGKRYVISMRISGHLEGK